MKKILFLVVALIAAGYAHANGTSPESPVGVSVIKSGDVVKLFYRGEQTGRVKVTIYNADGQKVFVEILRNTEQFMRPYNFSALPEGDYTIEIADEQGTRSKKVNHTIYTPEPKTIAHLTRLDPGTKYVLAVPDAGEDVLTIRIFDGRNNLLYQGTEIVDGTFAKLYNLEKIKGHHTFEVVDGRGNITRLSKSFHSGR